MYCQVRDESSTAPPKPVLMLQSRTVSRSAVVCLTAVPISLVFSVVRVIEDHLVPGENPGTLAAADCTFVQVDTAMLGGSMLTDPVSTPMSAARREPFDTSLAWTALSAIAALSTALSASSAASTEFVARSAAVIVSAACPTT